MKLKTQNPWLEISASDYVNHMSSPEVCQYQMINEYFRTVLNRYNPKKIFVPGCTIGNGFEHINWNQIEVVAALDINSEYLCILRNSFAEKKLQIINEDLLKYDPEGKRFDLIFAALIFEYIDLSKSLTVLKNMMYESSVLVSLIQLPCIEQKKVTLTKYKSLEKLNPIMNLLTAEKFKSALKQAGLYLISEIEKKLETGKSFLLCESSI